MFQAFLNPYTMIAGAALISSPIIIHLINRLRYRRVRWAAMEFLLKSQKRNRRRLIIEQLILLALRCLLVLLIGLLLARWLFDFSAFTRPPSTVHVVVLDDTPSMGDYWRHDGVTKNTFETAKNSIIEEIARGAAQARTPQSLQFVRLSALDAPFPIERLNDESVEDLRNHLSDLKPSPLHIDLIEGIRKAKEIFEQNPNSRHVLHVVGDFRNRDWSGGPADSLQQEIKSLTDVKGQGGAVVHLLDVADPPRNPKQQAAIDHGNTGILDLQPETRVAAVNMPIDVSITLANYTPAERKNVRVIVKVNGQVREDASTYLTSFPPGITQKTFTVTFDQPGFNQLSANLEVEDAGLAIDNTRYAVVDVQDRVRLLFIEGDPLGARDKADAADSFYLRKLFLDAARGFDVVQRGVQELEQPNLDQYPAIYLFNVPRLNDKAKANLERYVKNGGGVGFFLGESVNVDFYNQQLYADGRGLFPVPLFRATEPLTDQQKFERTFDPGMPPKLFARGDHPVLHRLYRDDKNRESNTYLKFLLIDRYFPVNRVRWNPTPGTMDELLTLPNYRQVSDYTEEVQRLLNELSAKEKTAGVYARLLKEHQRRIKDVLARQGSQPYQLANAVEAMLLDTADPKEPTKPDLRVFFQQPDQAKILSELQRLVESTRYGDPLLVSRKYGKGAVVAFLTTAGSAWNDFPNGPARPYWVMLMLELQKYLAGAGIDVNRVVGSSLDLNVDAARFTSRVRRFFIPEPNAENATDKAAKNEIDLRDQVGVSQGQRWLFTFNEARKPGVYRFEFAPQAATDSKGTVGRAESQAFAFNVDTLAEGDLRRATRDDIEAAAPGADLHTPGSGLAELLKERPSDFSEWPLIFLIILLVLVLEQAMAVRLSYHMSGNDASSAIRLGTRTTA